ncbi:MAG: dUTP diphosphatase [Oscillospiraceae bacterium]|nr:dUTP diphosphatase [Oscillospiraceae bacterium]
MSIPTLRVQKLRPGAALPVYGSDYAAGADLSSCLEAPLAFAPGETKLVPTGLAIEIPAGYAGLIYARSGLASKRGLAPANKVGVVDADYRGEVMVALHNHSAATQKIEPGERIAQLVVTPFLTVRFEEAEELDATVRGAGGFGSTGR